MGMLDRGGCHNQAKSSFTAMLLSFVSVVGEMSSEIAQKSIAQCLKKVFCYQLAKISYNTVFSFAG